ncbi:uncharacterized protein [Nicotiana tomentosiformis]|uniref:uncharacterized protein n=1 Tax=Nicotiana tomentosiformis TaxID=4098 RepID=UPI00388C92CB
MTVTQYESCFVDLGHHAFLLEDTEGKRVRRFIEGITYPIRIQVAKETGSAISFQTAANGARRIEIVLTYKRGQRSDKRSSQFGGFSGASSGGRAASPADQPVRGRGQAARGGGQTIRGGGQPVRGLPIDTVESSGANHRFYAFPARPKAESSDVVITVLLCVYLHRWETLLW